jgi:ubiquinone/menaquinone biosynthesis C-methylase UbiE
MGILEIVYYLLLAFIASFLFFGVVVRLVRRFYHFPIPWFLAGLIDNPVRRRVQSPKKIADRLDLGPGMRVVEIGPGPGTFTIEIGTKVAPGGSVYAFDISPKTIRKLLARIVKRGANNVAPVIASAYDLPLVGHSVDRVFMVAVLAEIPDRQRALREFARVLKPNGLLSISEFVSDPDYPLRRTVIRWCHEAGFQEISKHGSLVQYTLSFRPA